MPFFRKSWGVGFLNSAIFNSFHNRVHFGTILEGLRNFGGGRFEHPKHPSVRHRRIVWVHSSPPFLSILVPSSLRVNESRKKCWYWILSDVDVRTTNLSFPTSVCSPSIEHELARFAFDSGILCMLNASCYHVCSGTENIFWQTVTPRTRLSLI